MRKKQVDDILAWCFHNADEYDKQLCHSTFEFINSENPGQSRELSWPLSGDDDLSDKTLFNVLPSEISEYLAIYDYFYLSDILSTRSIEELLVPIASENNATTFNPDLRSDQLRYWVTMEILNSSSMNARVRWVCLFIEIAKVMHNYNYLTDLVFGGVG
jgi:hypothetical protein